MMRIKIIKVKFVYLRKLKNISYGKFRGTN